VLEQGMMTFALLGAGWVLWLLVGLSVMSIAISVERAFYLLRDGTSGDALREGLKGWTATGDRDAFRTRLKQAGGFEARVLDAGLEVAVGGPTAAEEAMGAIATAERLKMERGLAVLATVGSNAPFLGLFGTVLGIIKAFHDLGQDAAEASEAVMTGISEALVATAVGLLVAIPAVVLYNLFSRWVKARLGRAQSLSQQVVAVLHVDAARRVDHGR
jgi:biopolymer transport protein ExbB